jgi:hypothetical protein
MTRTRPKRGHRFRSLQRLGARRLSVVIDANVLVVLASDRHRSPAVERCLRQWRPDGEELHAPMLLRYKVASALANALSAGQLDSGNVGRTWQRIAAVPVVLHQLDTGQRWWRWPSD